MIPPLFALFTWPLVVLILARTLDPARAFVLAILGGQLLLPELTEIDLPLLPALTKQSVPVLSVLLLVALFQPRGGSAEARPLMPQSRFVLLATIGLAFSALLTVALNGDPLFYGPTILPGMRLYDGFSQILSSLITVLPLLLARKFLARPEDHMLLLKLLCIAGLAYSLLALFEVRMSPQLNRWVYGFFPHSWVQHFRGGGWRPIVFFSHGLVLSVFFSMVVLAVAGLRRQAVEKRKFYTYAFGWMFLTLVLCKSLGALVIALLLLPAAMFLRTRGQLIMACVIAGLIMAFPVARSAGIIPIQQILDYAEQYEPERAISFGVRVFNEDQMLAKANERPIFGWGGWGRSRVVDSETGKDVTIADGYWIIALGVGGWIRYLLEFGLLGVPMFLLLIHRQRYGVGMESAILALMLAGNMIDLIPNSGITPITWLLAGALWGRLELGRVAAPGRAVVGAAPARGYRRERVPDPVTAMEAEGPAEPLAESGGGNAASPYTRQQVRHRRRQA